jgi:hypothetical protein
VGWEGRQHIYRMGHLWLSTWHIFCMCQVDNVPRSQRLGEPLIADCNGIEPVYKQSAVSYQQSAKIKKLKAEG